MENSERTIVKFHIGRGGRFNNQGHLSYVGEERIDEGSAFDDLIFDEETGEFLDSVGNPLHNDFTDENVESGIGIINIDHDYNTTYTTYTDELTEAERQAIIRDNPYNIIELLNLEEVDEDYSEVEIDGKYYA